MKLRIFLLTCVLLAGCSVDNDIIEACQKVCTHHDGVAEMYIGAYIDICFCNDGVKKSYD